MNVAVICEFSGIVRDAFIAAGHTATSFDIIPTERPGKRFIPLSGKNINQYEWEMEI